MTYGPSLTRRTKLKRSILVAALASTTALVSSSALAAGFAITEQSMTGLGRSYAGAGVVGDDLSAITYNPAGITLLHGTNMQLGLAVVDLDLDYEGVSGQSENGRDHPAPVPSLYITHELWKDHIFVGLGLSSPYGLKINYAPGWEGRDRGISGSILTLDINPTIAWKINDIFSIGIGGSALYQHSKIKNGLPGYLNDLSSLGIPAGLDGTFEYKGSDWMWTWDVGIMVSPLENLRFGVSYRSAAHVKAKGDYTMRGGVSLYGQNVYNFDETTYGYGTLTTPETVYISGTWEATQKLRLSFTARWSNWKNFQDMRFYARDPSGLPFSSTISALLASMGSNASFTSVDITNDWRSTWLLSLGVDYKFTDHWTGRAGVGWESNPITDNKLKTALIPDLSRLWLSLGASWSSGKHWQIDAAVAELIGLGNKSLYDYTGPDTYEYIGKYNRLNGTLFGAAVQYHF